MDTFARDLKFAWRRLRRTPGFTLIALVSLALGIGANTAIFTLINSLLLRQPPITRPEQVTEVLIQTRDFPILSFSYPDFEEYRDATRNVYSGLAMAQFTLVPRTESDGVTTIPVELVNGDYFLTLGIRPALGRLLGPQDDVATGAHPVLVLSYDYWQRAFAGRRDVVGQELRISGNTFEIVGVAPADYQGTVRVLSPSIYAPIRMVNQLQPSSDDQLKERSNHGIFVKGRLRAGVTQSQALAVSNTFGRDMMKKYRDDWSGFVAFRLVPLEDVYVHPMLDKTLTGVAALLMIVVALVLLVACANLASFLLAQARDRQREIAIRLAIGGSRGQLVRQLLTETITLSLIGGAAGVLVAKIALAGMLRLDLPIAVPITLDVHIDARVLGFAFLVSVIAGVLFGLAPALQTTRADVVSTIKSENTGGGPARRFRTRDALVVAQVAMSLVLLLMAGLFVRSLQARFLVDPGFGRRPAAILTFVPSAARQGAGLSEFVRQLEERARQIPGVEAVGIISNIHLNPLSTSTTQINVDGFQPPQGQPGFSVDHARADAGFFEAADLRIVRGRNFDRSDVPGAPAVVIINEAMAQQFWPGQNPVGRTFRKDTFTVQVIGVARTAKIRSLGEDPRPFLYEAASQSAPSYMSLVARTRGSADVATVQLLRTALEMDPDMMLFESKTMVKHLQTQVYAAQLGAIAIACFAVLALALALLGIYGVVSYAVARRAREVGIRLTLGAEPGGIVRLLMRHGIALVAVGCALGLTLGFAASRGLRPFLYGVSGLDPLTFVAVPLLLLAVGALASFVPARRAATIDPARVLKSD